MTNEITDDSGRSRPASSSASSCDMIAERQAPLRVIAQLCGV
jgi:hypothetical protein